eukprot:evm.model.scf_277.7 EVM.evm.TU.scf_277.7   scf_277:49156-52807(+)
MLEWWQGDYLPCSGACGSGAQERNYTCVSRLDIHTAFPDALCERVLGPRPQSRRACDMPGCGAYFTERVDSGPCAGFCGVGVQLQTFVCRDGQGRLAPSDSCITSADDVTRKLGGIAEFDTTVPSDRLGLAPGVCDATVEVTVPELLRLSRSAILFDDAAFALTECKNRLVVAGALVQGCQLLPCAGAYWNTSAWSPCSKSCDGGFQSRSVACYRNGIPVGDDPCPTPRPPDERPCFTNPCPDTSFSWAVGEWSACTKECADLADGVAAPGKRMRNVACVDAAGRTRRDRRCRDLAKPSSEEACGATPCGFCEVEGACSGRGVCEDRRCECDAGYGGRACELKDGECSVGDDDPQCCPTGVVGADGGCCASGMVDGGGACCRRGDVLDGFGYCCSEAVDVCGACGGPAVRVDARGTCCSGPLDAAGICCEGGTLDECGACNGDGTTCNTVVRLLTHVEDAAAIVDDPDGSPARQFSDAFRQRLASILGISPESVEILSFSMPANDVQQSRRLAALLPSSDHPAAAIPQARRLFQFLDGGEPLMVVAIIRGDADVSVAEALNGVLLLGNGTTVESIGSAAVCGNGVCEYGERPAQNMTLDSDCIEDCPFPEKPSPSREVDGTLVVCSGRGVPLPGACDCFEGYTGEACGDCSPDYDRVGEEGGLMCVKHFGIPPAETEGDEEDAEEPAEEEPEPNFEPKPQPDSEPRSQPNSEPEVTCSSGDDSFY